jgi:UDP-N-acetyl-D-mannosaminuronate dehydrogenase
VKTDTKIVVVGLGEVGKPLFDLISTHHDAIAVDIAPPPLGLEQVDVLHICYPFQIKDFVGESARYIELFKPELTIVNSTVAVGTTRLIAERTGSAVVNSPVRGKHKHMLDQLCKYTKFVGAIDSAAGLHATEHFESIGMRTRTLSSPEATELAKLTETSYFGLMIAWAQELERFCDHSGVDYEEIVSFYDEIDFFPSVRYFPGVIGGHCVMPNIEILRGFERSVMLDAIQKSNRMKIERETRSKLASVTAEKASVPQPA